MHRISLCSPLSPNGFVLGRQIVVLFEIHDCIPIEIEADWGPVSERHSKSPHSTGQAAPVAVVIDLLIAFICFAQVAPCTALLVCLYSAPGSPVSLFRQRRWTTGAKLGAFVLATPSPRRSCSPQRGQIPQKRDEQANRQNEQTAPAKEQQSVCCGQKDFCLPLLVSWQCNRVGRNLLIQLTLTSDQRHRSNISFYLFSSYYSSPC